MMKPRLLPLYFDPGRDDGFDRQLAVLKHLLGGRAEFLTPAPLGGPLPEADAVVFPQLLGEAYRRADAFRSIGLPILIITSEFGTLSMWDWEIIRWLKSEGVETISPYRLEQTRKIVDALGVKRELRHARFLVYQDDPGDGAQAAIFKRFYWWEDACTRRIRERFGVEVVKRSFRELGARAASIADAEADRACESWNLPTEEVEPRALRSAVKMYLAVRSDLDADAGIRAVGMNCLNESHFCDTTPCLAWNMLFEERGVIWGCEGDTLSMLTKYLLHKSLGAPIMMTNLYPFLMGEAALSHERIKGFPQVRGDVADYILVAHCGYMGVIPRPFSTDWVLKRKVLAIVNDNATAINARLPLGEVTLTKLGPTLGELSIVEGHLEQYWGYPGSDCLDGGVIRVRNGHRLMDAIYSHHYLLMTGRHAADMRFLGKVFDLTIEETT
ncbi:MAG: hypothetical protein RBS80_31655 [Thermoguttaceae bacterium]|jgi:hypothetical protein|nr:hypothetical protein [Thermoguttaceae bacterium]